MNAAPESWSVEFRARVRAGAVRTVLSTAVLTGVFFEAYFWVQRHPAAVPVSMPRTALDALLPFQPIALYAYVTLWFYVGFGPGLQRGWREFLVYTAWLSGLCAVGLTIFYVWPTQVATPPVSAFPGFPTLHRLDETGNACPSMHVAVAIFTAIRVAESLRSMRVPTVLQLINVLWFTLIAYSTLAIKQHVLLDALAGAALGAVFALMSLRWRPTLHRNESLRAAASSV